MELASSFRSAVESAGMTFKTENSVPDDLLVWVDIDKWEKIIFNLIGNAFKFTNSGSIRVATRADQHYFYMEVQDTGLGIPADELSSIFDRFVRVENSQARNIEGTGIGLSLTLELVKAHGGKIGVERCVVQICDAVQTCAHLILVSCTVSTRKAAPSSVCPTLRYNKRLLMFSIIVKIPLGNSHLPKQYLINANSSGSGTALQFARKTGSEDYKLHTVSRGSDIHYANPH